MRIPLRYVFQHVQITLKLLITLNNTNHLNTNEWFHLLDSNYPTIIQIHWSMFNNLVKYQRLQRAESLRRRSWSRTANRLAERLDIVAAAGIPKSILGTRQLWKAGCYNTRGQGTGLVSNTRLKNSLKKQIQQKIVDRIYIRDGIESGGKVSAVARIYFFIFIYGKPHLQKKKLL